MNKVRLYSILMLIFTTLLSGCFRQDYSDCQVPENLRLKLNLSLTVGEEEVSIKEKMNRVDLFIYDIEGLPVAHKQVEKEIHESFPDLAFTVVPGEYYIVCWGNIGVETKIVGRNEMFPLDQCYIETLSSVTASPLYYASDEADCTPYLVTVPPNEETTKEISFVRAHRTIRVYLHNYERIHGEAPSKIRLVGMPASSDFFMRTGNSRKIHESTPTKVKTEGGERMMVSFNTMLAPLDEEMFIEVVNESGEVVTNINLKHYVDKKIEEIADLNELNIEVFYLMDGSVEISFVDWENVPLEPEW